MTIAIANEFALRPPAFHLGLAGWSQENGRPGEPDWSQAKNATIIPVDPDFGSCLEIQKQRTTTRIRYKGEIPVKPGVYLRISARVKQVSGPLCSVRIAGWAGGTAKTHLADVPQAGPEVALQRYGQVVEVSAIVGIGIRDGVDMSWGTAARFGHFGLDLVDANGGTVRIEQIRIEDVTGLFIPRLIDWVDIRDFGAKGDGVSNDRAAFTAADAAAKGGQILVPEGRFRIEGNLEISSPIRFKGKLTAPDNTRITFLKSFDYLTYAAAFGDETLALKKALQALFGYTDHVTLDLGGRHIELTAPLLIHEIVPKLRGSSTRRIIRNGSLRVVEGESWKTGLSKSNASYDPANPVHLENVTNISSVEVGSRVLGHGVGREVYVTARDIAARRLILSQPLHGAAAHQSYNFERYRYIFDFSGAERTDYLSFADIEFNCGGIASGIMLPAQGRINSLRDCTFLRPRDRGITSIGRACQGMLIDRCQFVSSDSHLPASERSTVAININANDSKIRNNRFERFGHFMVANGAGHIIMGNHWFQGDSEDAPGPRFAGLVLTEANPQVTITGNYIDNSSIEWTTEHDANPARRGNEQPLGGLTITGNTFLASNIVPWFSWLVIKPFGPGQYISGLSVTGNVFKAYAGTVDRVDKVDTSFADLDYSRMRNIHFEGNTFTGVNHPVANPARISHRQNSTSSGWTTGQIENLPFGGWAMMADACVATSAISDGSNKNTGEMPWIETKIGQNKQQVRLNWSRPVKGQVSVLLRMDQTD